MAAHPRRSSLSLEWSPIFLPCRSHLTPAATVLNKASLTRLTSARTMFLPQAGPPGGPLEHVSAGCVLFSHPLRMQPLGRARGPRSRPESDHRGCNYVLPFAVWASASHLLSLDPFAPFVDGDNTSVSLHVTGRNEMYHMQNAHLVIEATNHGMSHSY